MEGFGALASGEARKAAVCFSSSFLILETLVTTLLVPTRSYRCLGTLALEFLAQ